MNTHKALDHPTVLKTTKLRESCDSCLLAKVKCSKSRPVCRRCLTTGANCGYSPSSRAGRKHRNMSAKDPAKNQAQHPKAKEIVQNTSRDSPPDARIPYSIHERDNRPNFSASSVRTPDRPSPKNPMVESRLLAAQVQRFESADLRLNPLLGDDLGDCLQFSPSPFFSDHAARLASPKPIDVKSPNNQAWAINGTPVLAVPSFQNPIDMTPYDPSLSSASSDGLVPQDLGRALETNRDRFEAQCDCFAACIQALQALHNHSWLSASTEPGGLPFDVVLTINREALRGCGGMLDCVRCVSKTGSSISTMLLGTIFGKIISLYGAACLFRFGPTSDSQAAVSLAYGAYTLTGEDRGLLEMEIIIRELKKVESVLIMYQERFRNAGAEKDESSIYDALTGYLEKNLHYILDFLHSRKGGF